MLYIFLGNSAEILLIGLCSSKHCGPFCPHATASWTLPSSSPQESTASPSNRWSRNARTLLQCHAYYSSKIDPKEYLEPSHQRYVAFFPLSFTTHPDLLPFSPIYRALKCTTFFLFPHRISPPPLSGGIHIMEPPNGLTSTAPPIHHKLNAIINSFLFTLAPEVKKYGWLAGHQRLFCRVTIKGLFFGDGYVLVSFGLVI